MAFVNRFIPAGDGEKGSFLLRAHLARRKEVPAAAERKDDARRAIVRDEGTRFS
jgi:hypothetical protein